MTQNYSEAYQTEQILKYFLIFHSYFLPFFLMLHFSGYQAIHGKVFSAILEFLIKNFLQVYLS